MLTVNVADTSMLQHYVAVYLPFFMSCVTIYTLFLVGDKKTSAWILGLLNQGLWFTWILTAGAYGFLPMTCALTFVYARNYLKWRQEEQSAAERLQVMVAADKAKTNRIDDKQE